MVRVAGLMDQINSGYTLIDPAGMTPQQQLTKLTKKIHDFSKKQYLCLSQSIMPALNENGFTFLKMEQMSQKQLSYVENYFNKILFPILTPLAVDKSRPFPILSNKSLNISIKLTKNRELNFAVIQVPSILPRFLKLPSEKGHVFVLLEKVIIQKLSEFFELHEIEAACTFRITRNTDLDIDEEAEDLLAEIQKSIKKRKLGKPVRLEISDKIDSQTKDFLIDMLEVNKNEIYKVPGPLDLTFLSQFAKLNEAKEFRFNSVIPVNPPADFWGHTDVFKAICEKDRMVHHPYESFDSVINFISQAAEDKDVLAIKQTLYRVSGNSPIVAALMRAAENGKQVTVLVELKARFDEENNIQWAKKLEHAGCHVIYGLAGLKTHCKILLVARREADSIRRYVHLSTGNYNESTAKLYTDIGIFTCRETFGSDISSLFNVLTGYSRSPEYENIVVAPLGMRKFFEQMIQNEIINQKNGLPSGIAMKVNAISDLKIIKLLYEASQAGVKIKLIVRGICCLIPGIEGISDNITVVSIVGQLLEHSRIFKFECAGLPKVFMGSADLMPRNLDRRVEILFSIKDSDLKQRTFDILEILLRDTTNARQGLPDTTYLSAQNQEKHALNSQIEFLKIARRKLVEKKNKLIF
jgi:polyphosphate kinase